ncbi:uncharacterized protein LOC130716276 [Lotus japonicus]|uniref:uncharacterized protein LOC130716276 n=1 Tax=Lotus japonicus TaxID=34305 RepID=UPI00258DBB67|nr:uncharacterized protein LOC130716276 [Lotus japonicus]
MDIGAVGMSYTWFRNCQGRLPVHKRLDRALASLAWRLAFLEGGAEVLPRLHSDHSAILLRCGKKMENRGGRPFRFEAAWTRHPLYKEVVHDAWLKGGPTIPESLHEVRVDSLDFNRRTFGNIFRRKRHVENCMASLQHRLETVDSIALLNRLDALRKEHIIRRKRNRIVGLNLPNGAWCDDADALQTGAIEYFKALFADSMNVDTSCLITPNLPTIPEQHVLNLVREVTKEEVFMALQHIGSFKAPGPDGFHAVFYKTYWDVVGDKVFQCIRNVFETQQFDPALGETLIVLIPKIDCPLSFKDFRPISLCNVIYKLITKILVNRIRPCLNEIISPNQSSFIPGRCTSDNAIALQEIVYYQQKARRKSGNLVFKLDLEKAYDRVNWSFLEETLVASGFPPTCVRLIMFCVTASQLSILWNGERLQSFSAKRGLRQGDPLSPYLFVLCMERFSSAISTTVMDGRWDPVCTVRNGPDLSHLFFADDVLLFIKDKESQVKLLKEMLDNFCKASGLKVNEAKSKILAYSGFQFTVDIGRYLGFPIFQKRVTKEDFNFIFDRINSRLADWKCKLLNKAGRLTLAQSVISAMSSYCMSQVWVPQRVCDKLDSVIKNFVWKNRDGRGINLVGWDKVALPKRFGGLGLQKARGHNIALLVLKLGFEFKIGDELSSFWFSSWCTTQPLGQLVQFVNYHDTEARIKDVWDGDRWRLDRLWTVLPDDLTARVNMFPARVNSHVPDGIRWTGHVSGEYSTSTGYNWIISQRMAVDGVLPGTHSSWSWIWRLKIPLKCMMLIWLALQDALPTNFWRFKRGMASSAACVRCNGGEETVLHCLRDCPAAWRVWILMGFDTSDTRFYNMDCQRWLRDLMYGSSSMAVATLWWIWRARNAFCMENLTLNDQFLGSHIAVMGDEISRWIANSESGSSSSPHLVRWQPRDPNCLVINVDGSVRGDPCKGGFGGCFRSGFGQWHGGFYEFFNDPTILHLELLAIFHELTLAWDRGVRAVECQSDSLDAVKLESSGPPLRHAFASLIWDIKDLLNRPWQVALYHTLREGNACADFLAKHGAEQDLPLVVIEHPLVGMNFLVLADALGVSSVRP